MAKQTSLYLHTGHNASGRVFTSADTTSLFTIFTPGANDSDLKMLSITTDDTATVNIQLWYNDGSTSFLLGTVRAVTLTGFDGATNAVDVLNSTALPFLPVDDAGKRYLPVKTGHTIKASCKATMTASKSTYLMAVGHDY